MQPRGCATATRARESAHTLEQRHRVEGRRDSSPRRGSRHDIHRNIAPAPHPPNSPFIRRASDAHDVGDPLRKAQAFFGERAQAYRASASHADAAELARMIAWIEPRRGERALDVATGGGHTARALAQAGCDVVATDATRAMLAEGQAQAQAQGRVLSDAQAMPFGAGTFDVVACRIAAHHFQDLPAFVRECARVLRRAGRLYVFDLTSPEDAQAAQIVDRIERLRDPSHVWSHAPSTWRAAIGAAGLRLARLETPASTFGLEPWLARAKMAPAADREARALLADNRGKLGGYGLTDDGRMRVLRVELLAIR